MKGGPPGGIGDTPSKLATQFTGSGEGQETPHTSLPGNTSTLGEDSGKSAKPGEFRQPIAPTLRTSRDDSESEGLAGRPEHVSGAGAAEFPLTAQTYFCDSRSPLRDLPLPLRSCSSHFFSYSLTAPLPLTRFLARSAPLLLQYISSSKLKSGPIFTAQAAMIAGP